MKTEECPCCNGTGKIKLRTTEGNPEYREHSNRTLPFDYYCPECKQFVTSSHATSYGHKIFGIEGK